MCYELFINLSTLQLKFAAAAPVTRNYLTNETGACTESNLFPLQTHTLKICTGYQEYFLLSFETAYKQGSNARQSETKELPMFPPDTLGLFRLSNITQVCTGIY